MKFLFYSLTSSCIVLSSCSYESKQSDVFQKSNEVISQSVIKPIEGLEVEIRVFSVSGTEASKIDLPNGGSIEFEANSFVDINGNSVEGKVDIEWQEYHSLIDIMLSGIPMKYDSLGINYDFVSGGMFTIKAKQEGKSLDLAPNKTAVVNLASLNDTPDFNFYELNEKTGIWTYETTKSGEPLSTDKKQKESNSTNELVDVKIDVSAFPELENAQIVAWRLKEKLDAKNKTHLKNISSSVHLEKNDTDYTITFNGMYGVISVKAEPYTMQDALANKQRMIDKLDVDYSELMKFQENAQQGKLVRSIEISGMGTYNWDKVLMRDTETSVIAHYNFNHGINPELISLYFISPEENVIISCNSKENHLKFNPMISNYLVAIMPDNSVQVATNKEFKNASSKKSYTFNFSDLHQKANSPKELGDVLQAFMKKTS